MVRDDHRSDRPRTPVIIGITIAVSALSVGGFYLFLFAAVPGGTLLQLVVVFGTAALIAAVVVVVRSRLKELEEEDTDDYRKY